MVEPSRITGTIGTYVEAFNARDRARWVGCFADDARQEDPVGQPANIGHDAIGHFFDGIGAMGQVTISQQRAAILTESEAIVFLRAVTRSADATITVPFIVDHMVFADDGRITSLRAFWDSDSIEVVSD